MSINELCDFLYRIQQATFNYLKKIKKKLIGIDDNKIFNQKRKVFFYILFDDKYLLIL